MQITYTVSYLLSNKHRYIEMYVVFLTMFFTMFNKHEYNYYIYVIFFTMCHYVVIICYVIYYTDSPVDF